MMTAAEGAASRQCAVPRSTTPRKLRSVSPPFSLLYGSALSQRWTARGERRRLIIRRSAAVKASRGGVAASVRGSGSRFEIGNEVGRRPHVAPANLHERAVGIDGRGAQVVSEHAWTFVARFGRDAELRG